MKKQAKEVREFKGLQTHPRERRYFSEEFRKARAKEWDDGAYTVKEISRMYLVSEAAVYIWLEKFSLKYQKKIIKVVELESESYKRKELEKQVATLERLVGQQQVELEFYKQLLQTVEDQYGFDAKKNTALMLLKATGKNPRQNAK